jgi:hypothetical protein
VARNAVSICTFLILVAGCTPALGTFVPATDHPANPSAPSSAAPELSEVLLINSEEVRASQHKEERTRSGRHHHHGAHADK